MTRAYLLVFSRLLGTKDEVREALNTIPEVVTWRRDFPQVFYLLSDADSQTLARAIKERFPKGRFLVSEIAGNKYGWLPKDSWSFINQKKTSGSA